MDDNQRAHALVVRHDDETVVMVAGEDEMRVIREAFGGSDYCCRGECCGPGSWCCAHAGPHDHPGFEPVPQGRCSICHERIRDAADGWRHVHSGDRECWTGDGSTAYP